LLKILLLLLLFLLLEIILLYLKCNSACQSTKEKDELKTNEFWLCVGPQAYSKQKNSVKIEILSLNADHLSVSFRTRLRKKKGIVLSPPFCIYRQDIFSSGVNFSIIFLICISKMTHNTTVRSEHSHFNSVTWNEVYN